jgi:large subunit ribosomal protein L7e
MSSEAAKVAVPESVLRKAKREEQWASDKKEKALAEKKKAIESRKVIFTRAKQYAEEYEAQVRSPLLSISHSTSEWTFFCVACCPFSWFESGFSFVGSFLI